ncbi:RraA family protein [Nocardia callitridis]|uniref:Putative 4-hydroxy-4-methyl-2-oxoglutarate aldolase n=1 Tax=Nocardia callitridis TaxID=648753 RepID=A0ABP9K5F3_9NOCA
MNEPTWVPLDPDLIEKFRAVGTATVASQLLKRGLRDQFVAGVTPLAPDQRIAGAAWTMRMIPSREDLDGLLPGSTPVKGLSLFEVIESTPAGAVLVIDGRGETRTATGGDILIERLRVRGGAGLVTDGCLRDVAGVRATDLPCYSAGATANVSRAYLRVIDQNIPVGCGGTAVYPGDVLVGDGDGVIVVPRHLAEEVALGSVEQERLEEFLIAKVRAGAPLAGVYPPSASTREEYRRSITERQA